jgi:hypothetical protein
MGQAVNLNFYKTMLELRLTARCRIEDFTELEGDITDCERFLNKADTAAVDYS